MANEIDLYKDLTQAEKLFKIAKKNKDILMAKSWKKECENIRKKIIIKYPDLKLNK